MKLIELCPEDIDLYIYDEYDELYAEATIKGVGGAIHRLTFPVEAEIQDGEIEYLGAVSYDPRLHHLLVTAGNIQHTIDNSY